MSGYGSSEYGAAGGGGGSGDLLAANNLSDVASAATALANLGGVGVATISLVTASLAAAASEDNNIAVPSSNILIVQAQVTRTAGASITVTVESHPTDAFGGAQSYVFGSFFGGVSIAADPVYGPKTSAGGTDVIGAVPYADVDASNELHLRVTNNDGAEAGTFRVRLWYVNLGAL